MPKKKSKTNFQKFVERRSRQKENKMAREEYSSNIFETEPSLLTNEQNFINDLYNEISKYNLESIRQLAKTQYNESYGLNIVEEINKNKSWKAWMQGYFDSLWNCLRIFNLKHFFTDYMITELSDLPYVEDEKDSDKPKLTLKAVFTHINEIILKYETINMYSLIYNCVELYLKNKPCKMHKGGNKTQRGGSMLGGIILILIILACIFAPPSEPSDKKSQKKKTEEPAEEDEPSFIQAASEAYIAYKVTQGLFRARSSMRGYDD
jgi:hypothetical protein